MGTKKIVALALVPIAMLFILHLNAYFEQQHTRQLVSDALDRLKTIDQRFSQIEKTADIVEASPNVTIDESPDVDWVSVDHLNRVVGSLEQRLNRLDASQSAPAIHAGASRAALSTATHRVPTALEKTDVRSQRRQWLDTQAFDSAYSGEIVEKLNRSLQQSPEFQMAQIEVVDCRSQGCDLKLTMSNATSAAAFQEYLLLSDAFAEFVGFSFNEKVNADTQTTQVEVFALRNPVQ